jgi:hypothetical protein
LFSKERGTKRFKYLFGENQWLKKRLTKRKWRTLWSSLCLLSDTAYEKVIFLFRKGPNFGLDANKHLADILRKRFFKKKKEVSAEEESARQRHMNDVQQRAEKAKSIALVSADKPVHIGPHKDTYDKSATFNDLFAAKIDAVAAKRKAANRPPLEGDFMSQIQAILPKPRITPGMQRNRDMEEERCKRLGLPPPVWAF